ncbi:MAG: beta-CASP ribonuclease aCPSF1, partial [Candidatus Diapherotrites archaeon]|nr:beta-CASP ribonuclease aCPSF1 [Candidatus Diapherotrites archaeon]
AYLDGMTREASAIHTAYPQFLKNNIRTRTLRNDSPFISDIFHDPQGIDRKELVAEGGNVFIASSGMLNGGPSLEYFKLMAEDPKNAMVFSGWQGEGTLGRRILSGTREIAMNDAKGKLTSLKINMRVENAEAFSGHSDRRELTSFLTKIKPKVKRVLVIHGNERTSQGFSDYVHRTLKTESYALRVMDGLRLH